jgi:hypothetical protein
MILDITTLAGTAEEISLYIINETNADDIDVEHGNLTIVQLGGT